MENESVPPCAVHETLEHERAWELRPRDPAELDVFILFCPLCACEVGSGLAARQAAQPAIPPHPARRSAPHGERGRTGIAQRKTEIRSVRCADCGRDLPSLPPPYPPQTLCAFCARFG